MKIGRFIKRGEDLKSKPSICTHMGEDITNDRTTAIGLEKRYNHTPVHFEEGEYTKEIYKKLRSHNLIIVYVANEIVDYIFKNKDYSYVKMAQNASDRSVIDGIKGWNAPKKVKLAQALGRERQLAFRVRNMGGV